jgi:hypothetical protein
MANIFPSWSNHVPLKIILALGLIGPTTVWSVYYYFGPSYTRVGYMPTQPVAYDHYLHATQVGLDCRYCHTYVDKSGHANVPDAGTCMNCHNAIKANSPALAPIREAYADENSPISWVRIHQSPHYAYFNHAVHVNRGVSCVECHGQVNEMEVVWHDKTLSMAFCLECHRNPEQFVRPLDEVYNLNWEPESQQARIEQGTQFVHDWKINPPQSCSGCHR